MSIEQKVKDYQETLGLLADSTERYRWLIELGRRTAPFPPEFRRDEFRVRGCLSQVWLVAQLEDHKLMFSSDSDAAIVKGTVALIADCYSGVSAQEIVNCPVNLYESLGLEALLSMNRRNGAYNMLAQIKQWARLFENEA